MATFASDKPLGLGMRSEESKREAEMAELNDGEIPRFQVQIYDPRDDLPKIEYTPNTSASEIFMDRFEEAAKGNFRFVERLTPQDYEKDDLNPQGGWKLQDRTSDGPYGQENVDKMGSAALEALLYTVVQKNKFLHKGYGWLYGLKDYVTFDWEFTDASVQESLHLDDSPSENAEQRKTKIRLEGDIRSDYMPVIELGVKRNLFDVVDAYARAGLPIDGFGDPEKKVYCSIGLGITRKF